MKLLLDTQVFIWLINNDGRLGKVTLEILRDPTNQLNISYFSVYEMIIKASIGKLEYDNSVIDDLPKMGIELLLPDAESLDNYSIYNPENKDPFDNALITVARKERCLLVTSDPKILSVSVQGLGLINALK